ncbi:MAG: hypothetical protein NTV52_07460 [Acidobacteria bacterium]|nr:hypothetical protein [Acidobacteriota bacterium]
MSFSGPSYSVDAELGELLGIGTDGSATVTNYALESGGNLAAVSGNTGTIATNTGTTATNTGATATSTATIAANTGTIGTNTGATATSAATIATNTGTIGANTGTTATNTGATATSAATIAANTAAIGTNTGATATSTAAIVTNTGTVATNTGATATSAATIAANTATIGTNTGTTATNTGATATSAATIATNTGATATSAASIATNTGTVATNTGATATSAALVATNTARIPAQGFTSPTSSLPVVFCSNVTATGPAAQTASNNILTTDGSATACEQYNGVLLQVQSTAGVSAGVVTFEQSADGTNWAVMQVFDVVSQTANPVTTLTIAANAVRLFAASLFCRFLRIRISTTVVGGSVQGMAVFSQNSPIPLTRNVQQATASQLNATVVGSGNFTMVGPGAHSAASSGNPVRVAGRVNTAVDTTLVAGDTSDLFVSSAGQLVQKPYASAELDWQYTGVLTTTTAQAVRAAGAVGVRNYVTGLQYQNANATTATVLVLDGATLIAQYNAPGNMAAPAVIGFATPLRGTAATALNVNCGTAAASLQVNVQGYQSA